MHGGITKSVAFTVGLLAVGVVSLADRAPRHTMGMLALVIRAGQRVERSLGVDWVDRTDVPLGSDAVAHVALWLGLGAMAYLLARPRLEPITVTVLLVVLSACVEVGQAFLTATRQAELEDLAANGFGVVLGVLMGLLLSGLDESRRAIGHEKATAQR